MRNPQINVEEITQNILIVLAIQNTILAQIRLTIYKSVTMSLDGYGLWDITDFATDLFVALLKNLKLLYVICPNSLKKTLHSKVSVRPQVFSQGFIVNIQPNTHTLWHQGFFVWTTHNKLMCRAAAEETRDCLSPGGVTNVRPVPNASAPQWLLKHRHTFRRLQIISIDVFWNQCGNQWVITWDQGVVRPMSRHSTYSWRNWP